MKLTSSPTIRASALLILLSCVLSACGGHGGTDSPQNAEALAAILAELDRETKSLETISGLSDSRTEALRSAVGREKLSTGKVRGSNQFVELATSVQLAFDREEANSIRAGHERHVAGHRSEWLQNAKSAEAASRAHLKTLTESRARDTAALKAVKDRIRELNERSILDQTKGGGHIRNQLKRLEDRLASLEQALRNIVEAELTTVELHGAAQYQRGVAEGAQWENGYWFRLAMGADSDEGPWARDGTDPGGRGSPGWAALTRSNVVAPANAEAQRIERIASAHTGSLIGARRSAQAHVAQMRDIVEYLKDFVALIANKTNSL